jgi:Putative zinc-finger
MTCHDARELFSARVDGALTDEERRGLDAHLAGCPECRRELARLEATVALLHAAPPARAPVGFVDRVLAAARPAPWTVRLRRRLLSPLALRRPIEVTVVALVALTAVYVYERTPELRDAVRTAAPPAPVAQAPRPAEPDVSTYKTAPSPVERVAPAKPGAKEEQVAEMRAAARNLAKEPAEAVAPPAAAPPPSRPELASPAADTAAGLAAPPAVPAAPPAAPEGARAEAKARAFESAGERERQAKEAQESGKTAAMARSSALTGRMAAAPDVAGTLTVTDRNAARRALAELIARVAGAELFRRTDTEASSVDVVIPGPAYAELAEGLGRIGRWQPDSVPSPLPAQIRVSVRLAAP